MENVFVYNPGQADKAKIAKRKFEVLNIGTKLYLCKLTLKSTIMTRLRKETF